MPNDDMTSLRLLTAATLAAGTLFAACGEEGPTPTERVVVRDSAGVRIVESSAPASTWQLAPTPVFVIGRGTAEEEQLFQVQDVVRATDGRVYIANDGSDEVKVFSPTGEYQTSIGSPGQGPGEFSAVSVLGFLGGDSLVVLDDIDRRVSVFDPAGDFVRSVNVGDDLVRAPWTREFAAEGALFMSEADGFGVNSEDGVQRRPFDFRVYWPLRDSSVSYGRWDGPAFWVATAGRGVSVAPMPFSTGADGTMTSDGLAHIGTGETAEVHSFDGDGVLARLSRWTPELMTLTSEMIDGEREYMLEQAESRDVRRRLNARYDLVEAGSPLPAFSRLDPGPGGEVWAMRYPIADEATWGWDVLDTEGAWAAHVELPASFYPFDIGDDLIVGMQRDEFGVEQIVGLRLTRND